MTKLFRTAILFVFAVSVTATIVSAQTELPAAGLNGPVNVSFDSRAIPYIEASSEADLYFAQGFITARDRLWQMDLLRRVAAGETAEIFGRSTLEEDKRWRRFGFAAVSEESLKNVSPEARAALDNYARGVNTYIATLTEETMPVEFRVLQYRPREWKASHSILIGKILADALSTTWRQDLLTAAMRSLPKEKFEQLTARVSPYDLILFGTDRKAAAAKGRAAAAGVPQSLIALTAADEAVRRSSLARVGLYAEDLAASNNWVISGKRSADGRPILANDPHLMPAAPGIWYLANLAAGDLRVAGVTLPGVPGIVLGHNEKIAWGATNVGPDVQDLYEEKFDAAGRYQTPDGVREPVRRKEIINVRSNPLTPAVEPVEFEVVETRNGVVIAEEAGKRYALKWTARDSANNEIEAFFALNRAGDWEQFKDALRSYGGAAQNFVYADTKGHIGWYAAGRIPVRRKGFGQIPYDGSTNDGDWVGFIRFEKLPHLFDPPNGLIITANQRTVGTSYEFPQFSRDAAMPWRARRIFDRLEPLKKVTFNDVASVQFDDVNIPLLNLAKEMTRRAAASEATLAAVKDWDGRMQPDSQAALVTSEIRSCLAEKIANENKPAPASLIRERVLDAAVKADDKQWLPRAFRDYKAFISACDGEVTAELGKRFGPDRSKWVWGATWRSRFPHPLAVVPLIGGQFATPAVPIAGSGQTPNVGSAVSMRLITSPGNWDATRHVIPLGQSGDPRSAHYKDQFDLWRTGEPAIFPFSAGAVRKAAEETLKLVPR